MAWIDYRKAYYVVPLFVDGGCSQEYDLYNQQLFCELEDSVDIRWSGDWSGCHQKRHLLRRLFVTLVVYSSHAATDTSAAKDKSWVQNGEGHEIQRSSIVHGWSETIWSYQRPTWLSHSRGKDLLKRYQDLTWTRKVCCLRNWEQGQWNSPIWWPEHRGSWGRGLDSQLLSHGRENLQESNVLPDNFVSLPKEKHDVIIHVIRAF